MTLENLTPKQRKEWYGRVARIGCILCKHQGYETQDSGCELHHIRRAGKRSNAPVIPLCPYHHRGNGGIHGMGRKRFEREYSPITEEELLVQTENLLNACS
jgi:hypothetical protein